MDKKSLRKTRGDSSTQKALLRGAFLCLVGCASLAAAAQMVTPTGDQKNSKPSDGEVLNYLVTYQWGPIYLEVGDVEFSTHLISTSTDTLWQFNGWGTSRPHWNWFYPVDSRYQSSTTAQFLPREFSRKGIEGRHHYDRIYRWENEGIALESQDSELSSQWLVLPDDSSSWRDVMTAIHWTRHIDWNALSEGAEVPLKLILDGEFHDSRLTFEGLQWWTDPRQDSTHLCWVFRPVLIDGTVFKAHDEMRVFVTADERRLPLFVETELVVGKARIYLTQEP